MDALSEIVRRLGALEAWRDRNEALDGVSIPIMQRNGNYTVNAGVTHYFFLAGGVSSANEPTVQQIMACSGTLRNFRIRTTDTQDASGSLTFTLRVNGVATAITVTVPAEADAAIWSDLSHAVRVAAGDLLSFSVVNAASSASATHNAWSMEFVPGE